MKKGRQKTMRTIREVLRLHFEHALSPVGFGLIFFHFFLPNFVSFQENIPGDNHEERQAENDANNKRSITVTL